MAFATGVGRAAGVATVPRRRVAVVSRVENRQRAWARSFARGALRFASPSRDSPRGAPSNPTKMRRDLRAAGQRRIGAASTDARARRARRRPGHHARRHQRRRDRRHAHRVHRTRVPIAAPPGSAIKRVASGGRPSPEKKPRNTHDTARVALGVCRRTGPLRTLNHGSRTMKNISIKSASRQTRDPLVYGRSGFFWTSGPFDRSSYTWRFG